MAKTLYLRFIAILTVFLLVNTTAIAQIYYGSDANEIVPGATIVKLNPNDQVPEYLKFKTGEEVPFESFQLWLQRNFKIDNGLTLQLLKTETDQLGITHYRFKQSYNNIPLEWTHYYIHVKKGLVTSANGNIYSNLNLSSNTRYTEEQALNFALDHINAIKYKWDIAEEEELLKRETGNRLATYFPKGDLVYIDANENNNFVLAYRFNVYAHDPLYRADIYIDASNGNVLFEHNLIHTDVTGTAVTRYSGNETIECTYTGSTYILKETGRGLGIETYDLNTSTNYGTAVDFEDPFNFWNNINAEMDEAATDAHWGAEMSYDYFNSQFNRNSIDNNGFKIKNYVHYSVNLSNAFWDGDRLSYGDGINTPRQALDICGHEFTHGVTEHTAGLLYLNESGALNESFSDIFGTTVEFYAKPGSADWLIGADRGPSAINRSMAEPNLYSQPDTYLGTSWYSGLGDNGGVHYNSGVQNYWFYLLSIGGSGTNDNGDLYNVTGISIDSAASIAYRTLSTYLGPTSKYVDARFYSIIAATDLFGECSSEVESVTEAWYAVGVGAPFTATVTADFTADLTTSCHPPFTINFTNLSSNATNFTWDFSDGNLSTDMNPSYTYNTYGSYAVILIADGGICGNNTINKKNYIQIDSSLFCNTTLPDINGANEVQTGCSGTLYDNGGAGNPYSNGLSSSTTIAPTNATSVTITTISFDIETGGGGSNPCDYDYVEFFDGPTTSSPSLGQFCNTTGPPGVITSSGGSITIELSADAYVFENGFEMQWACTIDTSGSGPIPTAAFSADDTVSCLGLVKFTDLSTNSPTTWNWNFGDLSTSTSQNPTHTYINNGFYDVTLISSNGSGSDTLTKTAYIDINKTSSPTGTSASSCGEGSLLLTALPTTGDINWYSDSGLTNLLEIGEEYQTDSISTTTIYYAVESVKSPPENFGPSDSLIGNGSFISNPSNLTIFDCHTAMTLKSVKVYATSLGYVNFEIRDSAATLINSKNVLLATGENTVILDIDISVGSNYSLGIATAWNLYSNSNGVSYPYNLSSLATITGNSLGDPNQYFYFYNWIAQELGCQSEATEITATILASPTATISSTTNETCAGLCNGETTASATGGVGSYTYNWSNLSTNSVLTSLCSGTYTVTVTDSTGCSDDTSVIILDGNWIESIMSSIDATCGAADGQAIADGSGGTAPYSYNWNDPTNQSSDTATGLLADIYYVTITDANGCNNIDSVFVNNTVPILTLATSSDPICFGGSDGSAEVTATGGSPPYTYAWDTSPNQTTTTATGLVSGSYVARVIDSIGCQAALTVNIAEPEEILLVTEELLTSCTLSCDASIEVIAFNTVGSVTYIWDDPNNQTTSTAFNLCVGNFNVTITDSLGCMANGSGNVVAGTGFTTSLSDLTNSDCGACNGFAQISVSSSSNPLTYAWDDPGSQTSSLATGLCEGTYNVLVTDSVGCIDSLTAEVLVTGGIFASNNTSISSGITCNGLTDGIASVSATGGILPYTYSWDDPGTQTSVSATGLGTGTFTVTVSDINGCLATTSIVVTEPSQLSSTILADDANCLGVCNGSATATGVGGNAPYAYNWSTIPTQSNVTATGLCQGGYSVTVTDNNGCLTYNSTTISEPASIITSTIGTDATCNGLCDGTASVTTNMLSAPYTYVWNDPLAQTGSIASNLCAGPYEVTVTDNDGCQAIDNVSISEPSSIVLSMSSVDATCGAADGQATVVASNGVGSFTYLWDDSGSQMNATATGLLAGLYSVTVTDGNSCIITDSVFVNNTVPILSLSGSTDASCFELSDGSATVLATGGTIPYTYAWDTSPNQTTSTATGLASGSYVSRVVDAIGCQAALVVTINEPSELASTLMTNDLTCNNICDGAVTSVVIDGTPPYFYSWNDPGSQTNISATGLCAGSIALLITDNNGCTMSDSAVLSEPTQLSMSVTGMNISCNGLCDGIASSTASGGTPPYQYQWNDPGSQTNATAEGLCSGTVNIALTDSNGCISNSSFTINEPSAITLSISGTDVSCNSLCDGLAVVSTTGGTAPYTFAWDDPYGQTKATSEDLCAGSYTVTVTDNNHCSNTSTIVINEPLDISGAGSGTSTTCYGICDGTATITSTGGNGAHTYLWNDTSYQTTATATGLCAGIATVTITDGNGCTKIKYAEVVQPPAIVPIFTTSKTSCIGSCDGTVSVTTTGANGPATYSWDDPGAQTTSTATGLCIGTITLTVTDSVGCTTMDSVDITEPSPIIITTNISNVSCYAGTNGAITLNVTGGNSPYSYLWNTSDSTQGVSGLIAGSYSVVVTDANNCQDSSSATITEPSILVLSYSSTSVSCNGGSDGGIDITVSGGTSPYSFNWSTSDTTEDITGISSGSYWVLITDANNCELSDSITLSQADSLLLTLTTTLVDCYGDENGTGTLSLTGGTPPYTYSWNDLNNQTTATATGLAVGNYQATVTDANGCVVGGSISIFAPNPISYITSSKNPSCFGGCDGEATVQATGGFAPYSFLWDDPSAQTNSTAVGLCSGTYGVTIIDANGCDTNTTETLSEPNEMALSAVATGETGVGANDGTIDLTISGGTTPYVFAWSNGTTTEDLTGLSSGNYSVTVTDNSGCSDTLSIEVSLIIGIADNFTTEVEISVFPNPTQGQFLLSATSLDNNACIIILRDVKGKLLYEDKGKPINGIYQKQFNLAGVAKGVYNLQVIIGERNIYKRILIE